MYLLYVLFLSYNWQIRAWYRVNGVRYYMTIAHGLALTVFYILFWASFVFTSDASITVHTAKVRGNDVLNSSMLTLNMLKFVRMI